MAVKRFDIGLPLLRDRRLTIRGKLVISYLVGRRTGYNAVNLMLDLKSRLRNRVQISTDSFVPYVAAVKHAFGNDVDYAQIVKSYEEQPSGRGRYSPPRTVVVTKDLYLGNPDVDLISTSYVECQNLSIRTQVRRMTRLTNAFSKKIENLRAAIDLHFCHFNFVRFHRSIR